MVKVVLCFKSSANNNRSIRKRLIILSFAVLAAIVCYTFHKDEVPGIEKRVTRHMSKVGEVLQFPDEYHTKGVLSLPYGDIVEPFEAWYSKTKKMSRIDYYHGMDRTFQREDLGRHGFACKIVPEYSEIKQKTFTGCLHRRGTKKFPIKAQSIIPAPLYFKYSGDAELSGFQCAKWEHSFTVYDKVNTYTLYTTKTRPPKPVRYEMMGYDTLLSSYYDHYILDYNEFEAWKFNYSIFDVPTDLQCFDFSGEKLEKSLGEINPMVEFMPHDISGSPFTLSHPSNFASNTPSPPTSDPLQYLLETLNKMPLINRGSLVAPTIATAQLSTQRKHIIHTSPDHTGRSVSKSSNTDVKSGYQVAMRHYEDIVNTLFESFKMAYKKTYVSKREHETRKDIYRHNLRFIKSRNRQHLGYRLKTNHMADLTEEEIERIKGLLKETNYNAVNGGRKFKIPKGRNASNLPDNVDWAKSGAVNPVRSQGICGSCYAYSVTGAMEGAYFIKTGTLLNLSEQQIIDCSWGFGNRGCKGGYPHRAMQWVIKHGGLATEASYGRYLAQEGLCHFKNTTTGAKLDFYMNITKGNSSELQQAVAFYGPVSILINTQPKSFKFYGSGIYYDPECTHALDHAALAVGYGVEKGEPYWLIKNSWSKAWGDEGYIKIAMKNDNCGVLQKAVVVKIMD
ncbi:counting factor associated protein D-like [Montipora capricornis]|uniref:counting factor associated protein D-like n=1 Tax=Montipora capricornis TaxID=246305 RepID=UPI0035F1F29A